MKITEPLLDLLQKKEYEDNIKEFIELVNFPLLHDVEEYNQILGIINDLGLKEKTFGKSNFLIFCKFYFLIFF